jgi:hypothetical protein
LSSNQDLHLGGLYRHYKGKMYRVTGIARHSETLEELVVYECLYENDLGRNWVRPKKMFLEKVQTLEGLKPRFERL